MLVSQTTRRTRAALDSGRPLSPAILHLSSALRPPESEDAAACLEACLGRRRGPHFFLRVARVGRPPPADSLSSSSSFAAAGFAFAFAFGFAAACSSTRLRALRVE